MEDFIKMLLSLSLSGTLLILLFSLLKPLYRERFSRRWQYYIWLAAALRLVLPFRLDVPLSDSLSDKWETAVSDFQDATNHADRPESGSWDSPADSRLTPTGSFVHAENNDFLTVSKTDGQSGSPDTASMQYSEEIPRITHPLFSSIAKLKNRLTPLLPYLGSALFAMWLIVALLSLLRKILTYRRFSNYLKVGCAPVTDQEILTLLTECKKRQHIRIPVALYTSPLIASPLLTGFLRPSIVLPDCAVQANTDKISPPKASRNPEPAQMEKLIFIFTHELIHYKRRDMFYKWFIQIVCCVHWFNPFVRFLAKETGRACELACDEAITAKLDNNGKIAYGNTLLSFLHTGQLSPCALVSMTLTEGTRELKERLAAIVNSPKKTKGRAVPALLTAAAICLCFTTLDVHAQPHRSSRSENAPYAQTGKGTFDVTAPALEETASRQEVTRTENSAPVALSDASSDDDKFWERKFVESYSVTVVPNHHCTICGAPVGLYQKVERYVYHNAKTDAKRGDPNPPGPSGATFSNHPCYMDAATRNERNCAYCYWIK